MDSKNETNKKEGEILDKIGEQDEVLCKIREIVTKSSDGKYIYRGQSSVYHSKSGANHPQVTSTLYRTMIEQCPELKDVDWLNMNLVQREAVKAARDFTDENYNNKEMLSRIQHYSGDTNLLDFAKDYLVALFFACYRKHDKDGKVFLLEISGLEISELEDSEEDLEIKIINPVHPPNRVIAQKSVFVQSRSGVIRDDESRIKVIEIPCELKQYVLEYLKEHHDISLTTIYNDLHGYIWNRKAHGNAIMELYLGINYNNEGGNIESLEEKVEILQKAITHFGNAIRLDPNFTMAYYNNGVTKQSCGSAKWKLGNNPSAIIDYKNAIKDYDKAIELEPKYVKAYNNRGIAKANCGDIKKESDGSGATIDYKDAIRDYDKAIELDPKGAKAYNNRGNAKANCGDIKKESGDEPGAIIDYKDAIRDYDKAIELDPKDSEALFNRGLVKENLGDMQYLKQALSDFEKANELALQQKKEDMAGKAQGGIERVTARIAEMD